MRTATQPGERGRAARPAARRALILTTAALYPLCGCAPQAVAPGEGRHLLLILPRQPGRVRRCVLAIARAHRARGGAVSVIEAHAPERDRSSCTKPSYERT